MTPEAFFALPPSIQIRRIIEAFPQVAAKAMAGEAPRGPMSPKFDTRIRVKGGFIWASETSIESLRFWHGRASAGGDEKYREKNQKDAKALSFFIAWREWFPSECWTGERNHNQVTGAPPSSKPRVHEWEPRPGEAPRAAAATTFDDDEYSGGDDSGENYF